MHFGYKAFVVAAMLFPAVPAWADEAADKAALAREAVELAVGPGLDGRINRMVGELVARLPADQQAGARAELLKTASGARGDLAVVFADYYAGAFTLDELKAIVAFYSSPAGRKLILVDENKPAEVNAAIQQTFQKLVASLGVRRP
ncbi:DUF2059 domain-containing protein [Xanthobacter sp. V4C-4]|uniref:DUF2059 domain-containing protein n=1 Tax=Xanthobacter cornucopiae TaxID=3119924 RepID=UPI003727E424